MERGIPIRSVCRSIAVLQAINRQGSLSLMEISKTVELPYPTACRIIQTLLHEGLIECEPSRKRYRATALVQSLSLGYRDHGELLHSARPHIVALTRKINWPVTITTRIGQSMIVRDSTHTLTSLTFNTYFSGYAMPILECASGQAYLAFCSDSERAGIIDGIKAVSGRSAAVALFESDKTITRIRNAGYTTYERNLHTANPGKTSSIGVPVFKDSQVVGAMIMAFFSSAMSMATAIERYVDDMKQTAADISASLSSVQDAESLGVQAPQGAQAPQLTGELV